MTGRWASPRSLTNGTIQHNTRLADVYANLGSAARILRFVLQSAVLGVGAYLVVMDQASGGIMIASAVLMGRALAPVEVALTNWKQFVAAREGIGRLRAVLVTPRRRPGGHPATAHAV
jgi:ABC-type protease/lipase transport system fused ATPase/permease subunit